MMVGCCAEPGQAILVHKHTQGVAGGDQDIDTKVKLEVIYQERLEVRRTDAQMCVDACYEQK